MKSERKQAGKVCVQVIMSCSREEKKKFWAINNDRVIRVQERKHEDAEALRLCLIN